jgi:hypothetical protein
MIQNKRKLGFLEFGVCNYQRNSYHLANYPNNNSTSELRPKQGIFTHGSTWDLHILWSINLQHWKLYNVMMIMKLKQVFSDS